MRIRHRSAGFTLVEVLVAVAIIAIAMAAVISAMARQADNAGRLRQKTIALWVAHDRLTELQLQKQWPDLGKTEGEMEMAGVKWKWHAEVQAAPGEDKLRRVDVSVTGPDVKRDGVGALAELSGFLMENP